VIISDKIYIPLCKLGAKANDLAKIFTYQNPEYFEKSKMGFSTTKCSPFLAHYAFQESETKEKCIVVPRGAIKKVKTFLEKNNISLRHLDNRNEGKDIDIELTDTRLEPQQLEIIELLKANEGGLIEMLPGGGKTIAALGFISKVKKSTLILVHEHRLRTQWEEEIKRRLQGDFTLGRLDGDEKREGDITIGIINSVYLMYKENKDIFSKYGVVIVDECFPWYSKVLTNSGYKNIKDVQKGDIVLTTNETTKELEWKSVVNNIQKKSRKNLISIKLNNGKSIVCTEDHNIYTTKGWISAKNLVLNDELITVDTIIYGRTIEKKKEKQSDCNYSLLHLWKRCGNIIWNSNKGNLQTDRKSILFKGMFKSLCQKNEQRDNDKNKFEISRYYCQKNVGKQSFKGSRDSKKSCTKKSRKWYLRFKLFRTLRKWAGMFKRTSIFIRFSEFHTRYLDKRMSSSYQNGKNFRISNLLQIGYWLQRIKNWNRSRWGYSFKQTTDTIRQKEGYILTRIGVESITLYSLADSRKLDILRGEDYVYDLTIEDNHNYFVENILVHNCHHTPAKMFELVVNNIPAKYRIGLTGTVKRKDQKEILMFDILGPVLISIGAEDLKHRVTSFTYEIVETNCKIDAPTRKLWADGARVTKVDYVSLLSLLVKNQQRNTIILEKIIESIKEGYKPLILSDRVDHCKYLYQYLLDLGYNVVLLIGATRKQSNWEEIRQDNSIQAIVAQRSIAEEGLDYPSLSALHLTCPSTNLPKLKQRIGRIRRVAEDKILLPKVYDYADNAVQLKDQFGKLQFPLKRSARSRESFYKKLQEEYESA